jgi:putative molybdopterin biosynthesis protein
MFRQLSTLDEAQKVIRQHLTLKPLADEEIPIYKAFNRVLARDVVATLDIPPFDRSTVDGYAVNAEDTFEAEENKPVKLRICGKANAGETSKAEVKSGNAVEIVTGAPIPKGASAVVMLEETELQRDKLYVHSAAFDGENVMKAGSDIRKGETTLTKGAVLRSGEIGILAAAGFAKVRVYVIPSIAILSTGAEVVKPGRKLPPGKIYDTNAYSLAAAVTESGARPIQLGVVPDRMAKIQNALRKALASADLVIASGGVSVGPKDLMPRALDSLGKPGVIVSGMAIRPGKPATVALIGDKMVFSLPGHPTSALLVYYLLVQPVIQTIAGRRPDEPFKVKAITTMRLFPARGRRTFIMVTLKKDNTKRLLAEPMPPGLSGAVTTLAKADGFVEIAENQQFIDAGEEVTVKLVRTVPPSWIS